MDQGVGYWESREMLMRGQDNAAKRVKWQPDALLFYGPSVTGP